MAVLHHWTAFTAGRGLAAEIEVKHKKRASDKRCRQPETEAFEIALAAFEYVQALKKPSRLRRFDQRFEPLTPPSPANSPSRVRWERDSVRGCAVGQARNLAQVGLAQSGRKEYYGFMAKVLSISSQVVYGHVGNSTAAFVLQRMGHEVLAVPTVLLSNRPGYKAIAGERTDPERLDAMLKAALANGWLDGVGAILTGYIPSPRHAAFCESWVARIKALNPRAIYLCDPIIGDEPAGVYVDEAAAIAIRDRLLPLAGIVMPNAFELGWLSGRPVPDAASAILAARSLGRPTVVVTSAPGDAPETIANILVEAGGAAATQSPRRIVKAHGTGDFLASIFLAHRLNGLEPGLALRAAAAAMDGILDRSDGRGELALIETQDRWAASDPPLAPLAAAAS